jgi:hypothetical protein
MGIKHVVLFTHDAQELYSRHGYVVFDELSRTRWMSLPVAVEVDGNAKEGKGKEGV